ncbi:MAG: pyridoxal phosphate-dependent decarboxylase family protein [Janthinobacterium lividum]
MGELPPLASTGADLRELLGLASSALGAFVDDLEVSPATRAPLTEAHGDELRAPPPRSPGEARALIERCLQAALLGPEPAGPRNFAYVPNGGLVEAAVGDLLSSVLNRYVTLRFAGPGLAAIEDGVIEWMASLFGLPDGSGGLLTTGGSQALLAMMVAARERMLAMGGTLGSARLYVSDQAHHSIAKAAHVAGLPSDAVRVLPTLDGRHLDPATACAALRDDRAAGLRPFLLVASAGTTNAGSIDPIGPLAEVARRHDVWFHVDGCYGGFFALTDRGRRKLAGMELADSITLDPHKSLFLPFGTGALLVRDPRGLAAAHRSGPAAAYFQEVPEALRPEFADLGVELTREARGLRVWLPLHLHGQDAFRDALDEKLDLASDLHRSLLRIDGLEVLEFPELTVVTARVRGDPSRTRAIVDRINSSGQALCSSTILDHLDVLRFCVLSVRTRRHHVEQLVAVIRSAVAAE